MSSKFVLPDGVKSRDFKIPDGVKKQTSFGENVYRTLVGAARDTAQATMELGYDVYEYATGEEFTDEQKNGCQKYQSHNILEALLSYTIQVL